MKRSPLRRRNTGEARLSVPVVRKCKACKDEFKVARAMQVACSPECGQAIAERKRARAEAMGFRAIAAETRAKREALKTRSQWLKEAQQAFNAYIRARDDALPCVSCSRHHGGKWNAGHYLSTGARPELRFEEQNVWKQCEPCNTHLSGNLILYRLELLKRIGQTRVDWLEGPHEPKKYTVEELKRIKVEYRAKARQLKAAACQ